MAKKNLWELLEKLSIEELEQIMEYIGITEAFPSHEIYPDKITKKESLIMNVLTCDYLDKVLKKLGFYDR